MKFVPRVASKLNVNFWDLWLNKWIKYELSTEPLIAWTKTKRSFGCNWRLNFKESNFPNDFTRCSIALVLDIHWYRGCTNLFMHEQVVNQWIMTVRQISVLSSWWLPQQSQRCFPTVHSWFFSLILQQLFVLAFSRVSSPFIFIGWVEAEIISSTRLSESCWIADLIFQFNDLTLINKFAIATW